MLYRFSCCIRYHIQTHETNATHGERKLCDGLKLHIQCDLYAPCENIVNRDERKMCAFVRFFIFFKNTLKFCLQTKSHVVANQGNVVVMKCVLESVAAR